VSPGRGRGAFASRVIAEGETIERAPVMTFSPAELALINQTRLSDYLLYWPPGPDGEPEDEVVVFGLLSMVNHSQQPNAAFVKHRDQNLVELVALRRIEAGEEILCRYRVEPWFDVV
jgi:SET domain-containing protein